MTRIFIFEFDAVLGRKGLSPSASGPRETNASRARRHAHHLVVADRRHPRLRVEPSHLAGGFAARRASIGTTRVDLLCRPSFAVGRCRCRLAGVALLEDDAIQHRVRRPERLDQRLALRVRVDEMVVVGIVARRSVGEGSGVDAPRSDVQRTRKSLR